MSISTTIDQLIQRANEVKICQESMKLIATGLTHLRNAFNETDVLTHGSNSPEDIEQILKAIDTIIASCNENEIDLNGVSYRDLQSLLFRLQWQLIQYEANMTDDHEAKIQKLNNAYYEMHTLVEQTLDETMKQRLQEIEQYTKENTIEKLRLLRGKHTETIESYLRSCIELHKSVPLPGLTADAIAKVTHTFYQTSTTNPIHLELPFTRLFTRLHADKSTAFERNELRRLLSTSGEKETSKSVWQRLVSTPYMISVAERNQSTQEKDLSEENIIGTKRWIVILGDPGSGKTSFIRWLVRHLAQTLLLNEQHSTDYGPLRIPILIRIGEFAKLLIKNPSLTVFDYIGKRALQDYVEQGQALIILDGLDEIPASNQRSELIRIVENFVDKYVQIPTSASVFDNSHLSRLLDDPSISGGNQLIITSRIVGYHAAPLAGQFSHYTIQPMDIEQMKKFVNYWFFQVHQQILDTLRLTVPNQGDNHAEALKAELEKPENVGLLTVVSNPSLISIICSLSFNQFDGLPLPIQRICQYDQMINPMLSLWSSKQPTIPKAKLIRILSNIALYIHKYSPSNFIDEEELKEVCFQSVKTFKNKLLLTSEDIQDIENQTSRFTRIIKEDAGILAIRDRSLYGFLHMTFQEYFTCLQLIEVDKSMQKSRNSEVQLVVQSLRHHIDDPRFRIPIALALGQISATWSQTDFDDLCHDFIQEPDDSDPLLPYGAYILITSNNDLVNYPSNNIFFAALDRLMIAAGQHRWSSVCPFLFDQITNALRKLRDGIVSQWINNFLMPSSSHDSQTITAFCHLIEGKSHEFENIKWLDQSSCSILQSLSTLDNEKNEFAIDRLLVKVAFSNHQLLPTNLVTFKGFLLDRDIPPNSIPMTLLPLIITLYGGLKRDDQTVLFDPSCIHRESTVVTPLLVRFLSITDHARQDQGFKKLKQECIKSFLTRIENYDESCETIDLCIATVCLYGIEYLQENITIIPSSLLRMTMDRLKYISMILRQFYFTGDENDRTIEDETTKFISLAIEKFQYGESARVQFLDLLDFLKDGVVRLRSSKTSTLLEGESKPYKRMTINLPNTLRKEDKFLHGLLSTDTRLFPSERNSCSLLHHFIKLFWILEHNDEFATQYRMYVAQDTIPKYLVFRNDEDVVCSLIFIPSHLQNLYLRLMQQKFIIIHSNEITGNEKHCLYFGHILTECLMLLSNASCKRLVILAAVITLLPWLRMHQLDNFGSSLLWALGTKEPDLVAIVEGKRQRPISDETGQYMDTDEDLFGGGPRLFDEMRRNLIRDYINQEHERLQNAMTENHRRNMKLYSASITLANICRWDEDERRLFLLNESVRGVMLITSKLTRLDALCVIALYSHSDCGQIQVSTGRSMEEEIEYQFNDIYPTLPLLVHTAIFIRCLPLLQHHQTIDQCLQNLFDKFADNDQRDQQAVNEALSPFLQSDFAFSPFTKYAAHHLLDNNRIGRSRSTVLKKHFNIITDENIPLSVLISNLYVIELTKDFHVCLKTDARQFTIEETIVTTLCQFESSTLTEAQAMTITNILSSASLPDRSPQTEKLCLLLSNALHRVSVVEFKAHYLLERWLQWKDSNELSPFANHAALLLTNSDLWSTEAAAIICDLLCSENDRFRHRAEILFRWSSDDDVRTSSKLGINVLLTLMKKRVYYQLTSASAKLNVARLLGNITLDIQSHLETLLWLERYRIHALNNRDYSFQQARSWTNSYVASYFSTDVSIDACSCINLFTLSGDLIIYMCDMIANNFFSFLEIDGDTTSNAVLESHTQFVISVVVTLDNLLNHNEHIRQMALEALMELFEICHNDDIRRAVACALGYVCNEKTYKSLFEKIQTVSNNGNNETSNYSNHVLAALISSYSYCVSIHKITFDQDDIDLFSNLLKHSSNDVVKAVRTGYGRAVKDSSFLVEMFGFDHVQCYHALIGSTAYLFLYDVQENSENTAANFIEQNPIYLSIFITELYDSIHHFTDSVIPYGGTDYDLAYGYPQYVKVASLIVQRIPAAFCAYVKDWPHGEKLKQALFYTSKQHSFPQRAACLTILSTFGELTVELCEMLMNALYDDPYVQNTSYKCLTCINAMKDEKSVLNLLFSYLKSKSMNIRYVAAKILLHLSKLSLIPFKQVQTLLNSVILDPHSNEDLWLIEEQENIFQQYAYYYAGPLKDVIYSLLVQHLSGETSGSIRRNELNAIDSNFIESEKAARLASCLYEAKTEANAEVAQPPAPNPRIDDARDSISIDSSLNGNESD